MRQTFASLRGDGGMNVFAANADPVPMTDAGDWQLREQAERSRCGMISSRRGDRPAASPLKPNHAYRVRPSR